MNKLLIEPYKKTLFIKNVGLIISDLEANELFFIQKINLPKLIVNRYYRKILAGSYHSYIYGNSELYQLEERHLVYINSINFTLDKNWFAFKIEIK